MPAWPGHELRMGRAAQGTETQSPVFSQRVAGLVPADVPVPLEPALLHCPSCVCAHLAFVERTLRSTTQGLGQGLVMTWAELGLKSSESWALSQERPTASGLPGPGLPGSLPCSWVPSPAPSLLFGLKPLFYTCPCVRHLFLTRLSDCSPAGLLLTS